MPFDGRSTDLPTLVEVAELLRHPEKWPSDFRWSYRARSGCAIGLLDRLYGYDSIGAVAPEYNIVGSPAHRIFMRLKGEIIDPTADDVADAIDLHLSDIKRSTRRNYATACVTAVFMFGAVLMVL